MGTWRRALVVAMALTGVTSMVGCSGSSPTPEAAGPAQTTTTADASDAASKAADAASSASEDTTTTEADASSDEGDGTDTTAVPSGQTEGLDDLDQNGAPDPTCGTQDFGAGLVLRVPCEDMGLTNEVEEGVILLPNSLFNFPAGDYKLVADISASVVQGRDAAGAKVIVFFFNSDVLFDVGQSQLGEPAQITLQGLAGRLGTTFPGAAIDVRGHTDSTGDPASNQTLSEQRAANVAAFLGSNGVDASKIKPVGMGQNSPLALETNPDGSPSVPGQHENRRVEVVVHPV